GLVGRGVDRQLRIGDAVHADRAKPVRARQQPGERAIGRDWRSVAYRTGLRLVLTPVRLGWCSLGRSLRNGGCRVRARSPFSSDFGCGGRGVSIFGGSGSVYGAALG